MRRRLIIVSPHFPPTNAADHQRVRQALPYLKDLGWDVQVVAVDARDIPAPRDEFLAQTLPPETRVDRVRVPTGWRNRIPGFGSLGYKSTRPIGAAINRHLAPTTRPGDDPVVYFSTTQFPVHRLIPALKRNPRVTVAMDFQDPWATDYYREHPTVRPPGGRLRFAVANALAFREEARVLPWVDGFTAVSPAYEPMLRRRYPSLGPKPFCVLPFSAAAADFDALKRAGPSQSLFDPTDGRTHWVYVGRGGTDMHTALSALFVAFRLARAQSPELQNVRLHFIGTDYAPAAQARCSIQPLAEALGVGDQVSEWPARVPYGVALRCLSDAHALIVPGSDDASYTASKIYPYLLTRKPMLTIFHEASSVVGVIRRTGGAVSITFGDRDDTATVADRIHATWFAARAYVQSSTLDEAAFAPFGAEAMTSRLSEFLGGLRRSDPRPASP